MRTFFLQKKKILRKRKKCIDKLGKTFYGSYSRSTL